MPSPFRDKTILITGGTGSFGHALLDALMRTGFREVRIFSRDELKQELMRGEIDDPRVKFHIGDVRSRDSVDDVMGGVDFVFHAAALKQVPSCDFFPMEAVATNVVGSHNVIESALAHGVKRVICLSTDKAVHPVNAMGMTKALMEKIAQATARRTRAPTVVAAVRYGNVMCSRGSVIPLFVKQILGGRPLTITEPGMTRFMLPLPAAIDLVLVAFSRARPGDIFVRKAPACTIGDLARALLEPLQIARQDAHDRDAARREGVRDPGDAGGAAPRGGPAATTSACAWTGAAWTTGSTSPRATPRRSSADDYTSHNTERLGVREMERLLLTLPEIRAALESGHGTGPQTAGARNVGNRHHGK